MFPQGSTTLSDNFFHQGIRIIIFGTAIIALWLGVDPKVVAMLIAIEFILLVLMLQYTSVVYFEGYLLIKKNLKREKVHIDDIKTINVGGWPLYLIQLQFKKDTAIGQDLMFCADQKFIVGITDDTNKVLMQIRDHVSPKAAIIKPAKTVAVDEEKPDLLDEQIREKTGIDGRLISNVLIGAFLLLIVYAIYSMIRG
jgi:hypothetical protein